MAACGASAQPIRIETTPLLGRFNPLFKKPGAARRYYRVLVRIVGSEAWLEAVVAPAKGGQEAKEGDDFLASQADRVCHMCSLVFVFILFFIHWAHL
jgi:hypothetical protein